MKFCSRYKLSNCVMHLQLLTLTIASFLLALHPSITYPMNQNAANKLTTKLDNHIKLRTCILYIDGLIKPCTFFSAILFMLVLFFGGNHEKESFTTGIDGSKFISLCDHLPYNGPGDTCHNNPRRRFQTGSVRH